MPNPETLDEAREDFINQWGVLGSKWGINRTMAQIHALLMVSSEALSTDDVMEQLSISRGNAHSNLRELVQWRLVNSVIKKGERKEFFEAEKDVARIFSLVIKERKSREFDPALEMLHACQEKTRGLKSAEAKAFNKQIGELSGIMDSVSGILDKASKSGPSKMLTALLKRLP